ncbi:YecA family protein [Aeromonas veronii]|uniref:YecA family protein n=1 Tax=Aeromonas veronii TaxID=654 RepID=UPI003D220D89
MSKLRRNDPCWCGSGKKFKKCHLHRINEKRPEMWEIDEQFRKSFNKRYCSCPDNMRNDCDGKIINAHTVSKGASLKAISENGHVYGHKVSIKKIHENNGSLKHELIGINKASTFTGFCAYHDKTLFTAFEDQPFTATSEQIFLLTYRTISREHFNKIAHSDSSSLLEHGDAGYDSFEQMIFQSLLKEHNDSLNLGVRDSEHHKKMFDDALSQKNYDQIEYCLIKFDGLLPFQCSGSHYPTTDFQGKTLQRLDSQNILDNMSVSIINDDTQSIVILSWLKNSRKTCIEFMSTLLSLNYHQLKNEIINYVFSHFENIYMKPSWWDALDNNDKKFLEEINQPLHNYKPISNNHYNFVECNVIEVVRGFV